MAYRTQNFQPLTLAQLSPGAYGLQQGLAGIGSGADLYSKILDIKKSKAQLPYAALNAQAEAASKLAYANLMGPQFLAKIAGNPDILANIPEDQKQQLLPFLLRAGSGNNLNNPNMSSAINQYNSNNNQLNSSNPDVNTNNNSYNSLDNQTLPPSNAEDQNMNINQPKKSFAENAGEYAGVKKEGEKSGELRATDIQDLGTQYEAGSKLSDKFSTFDALINNPTFRDMRSSIPGFQGMQLKVLKNYGTPEQQELVGQLANTSNEIIKDTISAFPGKVLRGEVDITKNMKVSENDPFNVIVGKVKSAETYKDLNMKRVQLTSDLMEKYHINKRKAEEIANKNLNAQGIIDNINKKLDYSIQIRNKKTGEIETVPVSEARKRGVPDV